MHNWNHLKVGKLGKWGRRGGGSAETQAAERRWSSELQAPCITELLQSWEREEFRLLVLCLWPIVLPEGSTYNTAESNAHSRNLGTKTEGRRVKMVV